MSTLKKLKSVSHNIAHHAVSGLSYIHPHLRRACKDINLDSIKIHLEHDDPCPESFRHIKPLRLSLLALKHKFIDILTASGFSMDDINNIILLFEFTEDFTDDYCSNCHTCIVAKSGKVFLHAVNYSGKSIEPNKNIVPKTTN